MTANGIQIRNLRFDRRWSGGLDVFTIEERLTRDGTRLPPSERMLTSLDADEVRRLRELLAGELEAA